MLAGAVTFILGTVVLCSGVIMTFFVPGYPGESFFQKDRLLLGVLPMLAAMAILSMSGWTFLRSVRAPNSSSGPSLSDMIAYCFFGSIGTIWLFFVVAALIHQR
jgi:hypothetical protein